MPNMERPQYPIELSIVVNGTIEVGRRRELLRGSVRSYPNDGEYLFSLGLESLTPLSLHGGYPVLASLLAGLTTFPSSLDLVFAAGATGGTDQPTDQPTDRPVDTPTDRPTDQPTDRPVDTPTDRPVDTPVGSPGAVLQLPTIFEDWSENFLDFAIGQYEYELVLNLLGRGTAITGQMVRKGPADFEATLKVVSHQSLERVGDLVRLLPLNMIFVPVSSGLLDARAEVHFLRADGQIVSGQLAGTYRYPPSNKSFNAPLFFTHTFEPVLMSRHPVSVQATGQTRSLLRKTERSS